MGKGKKTVKQELFRGSLIYIFIIIIIFTTSYLLIMYNRETSKALESLQEKNYLMNNIIDSYFTEIENTIYVLIEDEGIKNGPLLNSDDQERVLNLYNSFSKVNKNIRYIYSGYSNGLLLINDYEVSDEYNPVVRPWYQAALQSSPDIATGTPFQDYNDKEWLISTSMVIPKSKNQIKGVMSIDSSMGDVVDVLVQKTNEYKTSYSVLLNNKGKVIVHHNEDYLGRYVSEIINQHVSFEDESGSFEYNLDGKSKIACFSHLDRTNWIILTVIEKREILSPITTRISFSVVFVVVIAIFVGILGSSLLSRRFASPVVELNNRVREILLGSKSKSDYEYPNNEIGSIAREIENLTEQELYRRAMELDKSNILLEETNKELAKISITDQLTGIHNRAKIEEELKLEFSKSKRYYRPFSIIIFDIDHFKTINDTYGHQTGDSVLIQVAALLKKNIRISDVLGRWGGEEFLLLCPETSLEDSIKLAYKLISIVEDFNFIVDKQITLSAGCSEVEDEITLDKLFKIADVNLYIAKESGRNTVKP